MNRVIRGTWYVIRKKGAITFLTLVAYHVPLTTYHASPAFAVEIQPVIDVSVLGGQYFYNGADNAVNAVADLTAAPYLKFNDAWSLVPMYHGEYHGLQQVQDLIGGGTLFQDSQDHTESLKAIRTFENGLKLKAVGAYSFSYLRETRDETWGEGLYDNNRKSGGAEAEWTWLRAHVIRFSYDYYAIRFPNYTSLESQGSTLGLGRELNAPDVLDTHNHAMTLGTQVPLPGRGMLDAYGAYILSRFSEQHLVDGSGELVSTLRHDHNELFSLQGTYPIWQKAELRLMSSLNYTWNHLYSNQNHYDAGQVFYNADYYGNVLQSLTNRWIVAVGDDPWTVEFYGTLAHQKYSGRLTQDSSGAYGTDLTHVNSAATGLSFSYPISRRFHVIARFDTGWNDSNNTDQAVYQYHYHSQSYLMGFTYAY